MSDSLATHDGPAQASKLGRLGRYVLRGEIASGGMATVYLAHLEGPHGFEKVVAVKRIHPHLTSDRRFVSMFLDEARVAALIHHPNVCAVTDFGEFEGSPYLAMEYLSGESFQSVMKRIRHEDGPNPVWLSARIVHDAARGLHTAHTLMGTDGQPLGVVHRDVSPQNIFVLYDGVTKVVDFGVARARGRLSTTQTNEVKGKLPFMSPEQLENQSVDARTDLWALGVVLWEATVGRRLFRGQNDGATIALVLHKPIPKPSDFVPDYPAKLEKIIMRCLERDPDARYQTAEALADDLEEFLYAFGKPAGASQVKKWMESHFPEQIAARDALLRGEVSRIPRSAEDSDSSSLSSIRSRLEPMLEDEQAAPTVARPRPRSLRIASEPDVPSKPTPSRTWGSVVFALIAVAGLAAMLAVVLPRGEPEPAPTETLAAPVAQDEAAPVPADAPHEAAANVAAATEAPPVEAPPVERPVREARTVASPVHEDPAAPAPIVATPAREPVAVPAVEAPPAAAERPEPPTREASPATSSVAPGMLSLMAIPPASVRVDGRAAGDTPLRLSLTPGAHRVELRTEDGRSRTLNVRVESGETTRQRIEF